MRHIRTTAVVAALVTGASLVVTHGSASAAVEEYDIPSSGVLQIAGRGWGHGFGMSQYGARQAALSGLSHQRILDFYYPGTELKSVTTEPTVRVLIDETAGSEMRVRAVSGLRIQYMAAGKPTTATLAYPRMVTPPPPPAPTPTASPTASPKPTASPTTSPTTSPTPSPTATPKPVLVAGSAGCTTAPGLVRAVLSGGQLIVQVFCSTWRTWLSNADEASDLSVQAPSITTLIRSDRVGYRGALVARSTTASNLMVTNHVPMESYLRTVVPSEVSSSWPGAALRAQSVAARSYAMSEMRARASKAFDVWATTRSQYYPGAIRYNSAWSVVARAEASTTDAAVSATKGQYLSYAGKPALAMFSSSNGGVTSAGSVGFLANRWDPYDGAAAKNPVRAWTDTISAADLKAAYPSIGEITSVRVLSRTGVGLWGGPVTKLEIVGSKGTVPVTGGDAIRALLGTRSAYLTFRQSEVGGWTLPVTGRHIAEYGRLGSLWSLGYHTGLDLDTDINTPVLAAAAGVVESVRTTGPYGLHVTLRHEDGYKTLYAHFNGILVREGDSVAKGQQIGLAGTTGNSTGPHLHFEIRVGDVPANPWPWLGGAQDARPQEPYVIDSEFAKAPLLAVGSQGSLVRELQTRLGMSPVTGYFGSVTRSKLVEYQKANNLNPSGLATPTTWKVLRTPKPTPTPTATASATPTGSPKPTATGSATPTATASPKPTPTGSATASPKPSVTPTASPTPTKPVAGTPATTAIPLKPGSTGWRVKAVQARLKVPVTGTYDSATMRAVKVFQARVRQPATGVVTADTWRILLSSPRASFTRGSTGTHVAALQARLGVKPTGFFGNLSYSAVKSAQRSTGLAQTGIVTPTLWKRIFGV